MKSRNNTQCNAQVTHSRTDYFGALVAIGVLQFCASARPARALELQLNAGAPYLCGAVQGSQAVNGTPIITYSCSGGFDQQWNYVEGQFIGGVTNGSASFCLDVKGNGTAAGTLVDYFNCNGQQNQQWIIEPGSNGSTAIVGVQSGLCLDSSGGPSEGGGTQLVINHCSGSISQNWDIRRSMFELNTDAPFLCISVDNAEIVNGEPVLAISCSGAPQDEWNYAYGTILGLGTLNAGQGEKYRCLTASGGTSGSTAELNVCNPNSLHRTQLWKIENGTRLGLAATTLIVGVNGLCLDSQGGPSVGGGTQLIIDTCTGVTSQNWNVR